MDLLETLKIILDNPKLMEEHGYTDTDVEKLSLSKNHNNDFIQFMQTSLKLMNNDKESVRIAASKLIKAFE